MPLALCYFGRTPGIGWNTYLVPLIWISDLICWLWFWWLSASFSWCLCKESGFSNSPQQLVIPPFGWECCSLFLLCGYCEQHQCFKSKKKISKTHPTKPLTHRTQMITASILKIAPLLGTVIALLLVCCSKLWKTYCDSWYFIPTPFLGWSCLLTLSQLWTQ